MLRFLIPIVLLVLQGQQGSTPFARGQKLLGDKRFVEAAEVFAKITKANPQNARAWQLLGYSLHAAGKLEDALKAHVKAASFPLTAPVASYNAACVYSLENRPDDALKWIEKAWRAGYRNLDALRADKDFANLAHDDRFEKLLARLAAELDRPPFADGTKIVHEFDGEVAGGQFGWVAGNAGDVDADGVCDIIVGAPTVRTKAGTVGRIYVYSGKSGKQLFVKTGKPGDLLGFSVGGCGDVDGDGHAEFLAGGPAVPNGGGKGRVYVWSGKDGSLLHEIAGERPGDRFGVESGGIRDFDGDGSPDFLVGAAKSDAGGIDSGRVYVYAGKTGKRIAALDGRNAGDNFGRAAGGKFDHGAGLLVVGAPKAGPSHKGRAYVYRRTAGKLAQAFVLDADKTGQALGEMFVSILGDVDGDGSDDVYVSDWRNNAGAPASGRVYIVSGKTGKLIRTHTGKNSEGFGIGNAIAGDVDGDGHADLIVGAWSNSEAGNKAGKAYLISGKQGKVLRTYTCQTPGDNFGFDATGLGDVNGDGKIDFLITSAWSVLVGPRTGRVFVIAGG